MTERMDFDPAIMARRLFARVRATHELGAELAAAAAAEDRFTNSAGDDAAEAYGALVAIGARYPGAAAFQEFLIYTTWSHLMDETVPEHFRRGLTLCDALLARGIDDPEARRRVRAMRASFQAGLGEHPDDAPDYDADLPKGGD